MRILISEDDFISRKFLYKVLSGYGECDTVVDGLEALDAYQASMKEDRPYGLICVDIMMPKVDGVKVVKAIRNYEAQKGICRSNRTKIMVVTALGKTQNVSDALDTYCDAYAEKPVDIGKITGILKQLGFDSKPV